MVYEGECIAEINSIQEYLEFLKEYSESTDRELWYRGHCTNAWDLKPNLFRNAEMIGGKPGELTILKYKFVNFKNEFLKLKEEILQNNLLDILNLNDFQIMFTAQHYGLLTPTLDWTTDPLVALFFALDGSTCDTDEYPVVFIFKPGFCNEYSYLNSENNSRITHPICIDNEITVHQPDGKCINLFNVLTDDLNNSPANHVPIAIFSEKDFSHRICRQSGRFTVHGAVGPLNYKWNNITIEGQKFVDAIKINNTAIEEMKKYLEILNINSQTIYREIGTPLDKLCGNIKEQELNKFRESIEETNKTLLKNK